MLKNKMINMTKNVELIILFIASMFPVICNPLYLEPHGKNKHVIALRN